MPEDCLCLRKKDGIFSISLKCAVITAMPSHHDKKVITNDHNHHDPFSCPDEQITSISALKIQKFKPVCQNVGFCMFTMSKKSNLI